jgi:hypothetical protein
MENDGAARGTVCTGVLLVDFRLYLSPAVVSVFIAELDPHPSWE